MTEKLVFSLDIFSSGEARRTKQTFVSLRVRAQNQAEKDQAQKPIFHLRCVYLAYSEKILLSNAANR